ncbi:TniQ family protein [Bosea vaviloviae]|uniref:TniQ domain-containing protein n=1 Tax=Bosea vaviloviae TaxID=1526658 RepID=A0A0N0MBV9_9HYPH|nr:TniQ family protein [Bosea vaviloviae]KPH81424.1 hypothetical protein AE618_08840 [Bosea vaviloviae]
MWQPLNGEPALPAWGIVPQPDEPAHRFFARLTALNGQDSARSLAHQMGLNGRRASGLLEFCLALPIREKERLRASTASVAGSRVTLCGQTFAKFDWSVHMARVCPACLSESEHARNWWDLKVVFRCPFHDEPLIRESKGSVTRWWTKSPARFADGNPIREGGLVRGSSKTDASWEAYVLGRMSVGATVPIALLDDVASMADVVKAVEHVGRASIAGYSDRRPTLRAVGAAREEIIRTGFAALSEGYGALRCIAARVADASPTAQSGSEQWGARKLFGWLGRSYESGHPIVPEFERALRDEAHARSIYQGWLKLDAYKPANTPFTMVELARLVSLTPRMTRKLATELGLGDPSSNKRRRHLFTSAAVDQIKNFKESLLDRDGASRLMKIDRGHFDALVHEKRIVPICRFTDGGSTSDRFDPSHLADVEQRLCAASGDDWRQRRVPILSNGAQCCPPIGVQY